MLSWRCSNIFTIKKEAKSEIIEKKSRFIANVFPVKTKEEAEGYIAKLKKEFWDARHNVYAYILPGNIGKYSDDGEPQGTAGLPIFSILQKRELEGVLVIVTRYFGGILLGKGGLIRAYSEVAKNAIEEAEIYEVVKFSKVKIECEYNLKDKMLSFLERREIEHISTFGENVCFEIIAPESSLDEIINEIIKVTDNKVKVFQV